MVAHNRGVSLLPSTALKAQRCWPWPNSGVATEKTDKNSVTLMLVPFISICSWPGRPGVGFLAQPRKDPVHGVLPVQGGAGTPIILKEKGKTSFELKHLGFRWQWMFRSVISALLVVGNPDGIWYLINSLGCSVFELVMEIMVMLTLWDLQADSGCQYSKHDAHARTRTAFQHILLTIFMWKQELIQGPTV